MTEIDLIKGEIFLANGDGEKTESLAREIHKLRHLRSTVIGRGRRIDAVVYEAARMTPVNREVDPPAEGARDLVQLARANA